MVMWQPDINKESTNINSKTLRRLQTFKPSNQVYSTIKVIFYMGPVS